MIKFRGKKYRLTDNFYRNIAILLVLAFTFFAFKQIDLELTLLGY